VVNPLGLFIKGCNPPLPPFIMPVKTMKETCNELSLINQ